MIFNIIVYTVLFPVIISSTFWLLVWKFNKDDLNSIPSWSHPLAIGVAFLTGFVGILGWPAFPAIEATHWLFWLTILAIVVGLIQSYIASSGGLDLTLRFILLIILSFLTSAPILVHSESVMTQSFNVFGFVLYMMIIWYFLEKTLQDIKGSSVPAGFTIVFTISSLTCVLAESALLGQLLGVLTAIMGAALLVTLIIPDFNLSRSALSVMITIWYGTLLNAFLYIDLNPVSIAFLLMAPLFILFGRLKKFSGFNPLIKIIVQSFIVLCIAMIAPLITLYHHPITEVGDEDDPYYSESSDEDYYPDYDPYASS